MKFLIKTYQKFISPILVVYFGHACRFTPTCSDYFLMSLSKYGYLKGSVMGIRRILSCNPLSKGGYSPLN